MGNVRMRAEQINYGATNVKVALDDLDPAALIELNNRMNRIDAWKATVKTEEKTGAEVAFTNALALAALSLSANITPEQDLHGQSAPYVGGAGKNKLPMTVASIKAANTIGTWSGNTYTRDNGSFEIETDNDGNVTGIVLTSTDTSDNSIMYIPFTLKSGSYILSNTYSETFGNLDTYLVNSQNTVIARGNSQTPGNSFTLSADENVILNIRNNINSSTNKVFKPMIRLASESDATFAPYSNICPISGRTETTVTVSDGDETSADFTIQLGQTVYGGTLNLTTGVLTVDHAIVDMGTMEWTAQTTNTENIYRMNSKSIKSVIDYPDSFTVLGGLICEWYADKTARETYQKNVGVSVDNVGEIFVYDENYNTSSSATAFTTFISGCHLCYKLKTPTTIQLTPEQLTMLKGYNQISSDGGGDITVEAYTGAAWGGDES